MPRHTPEDDPLIETEAAATNEGATSGLGQDRPSSRNTRSYLFALPWEISHPGGVNTVVENLAKELRGPTLCPMLLVNSWEHRRIRIDYTGSLATTRFRLRSPLNRQHPIRSLLAFVVGLPIDWFRLVRFIRTNNITAINPHYPGLWVLHFSLLRRLGLFRGRLIVSMHGQDLHAIGEQRSFLSRWLWRGTLKAADSIVCCSSSLKQRFDRMFPELSSRSIAVLNGVDVDTIRASADNVEGLPERLLSIDYILSIGTFEHKKGQDVLISAFSRIAAQFPELHVVLLGRSGPTRISLERLADSLGVAERVIFFEGVPRNEVGAYIARSRFVVSPSRIEPFGIVNLEAGALGKAVLASGVGGIPEFIEDRRNGLLVPPEDPEELARQISRLLTSVGTASRLGAALRDDVERKFRWSRPWNDYERLAGAPKSSG